MRRSKKPLPDIDEQGLPNYEGVYLINDPDSERSVRLHYTDQVKTMEIDVYEYEPKGGLCCFADDFGSSGTDEVDNEHDCHVSVQNTGLTFLRRLRDLG